MIYSNCYHNCYISRTENWRRELKLGQELERLYKLDKADSGVWMHITPTTKLLVRSSTSKMIDPVRRKVSRQYPGKLSQEQEVDMNLKILAYAIVLDWQGMVIEGEDTSTYKPELMYEVFKHYPTLMRDVVEFSTDDSNFRSDPVEHGPDLGN